jgi:hydrogenase maturation protein HypF
MGELGFPVVATSGNLSDEPICTDELEAVARLRGIADLFLVHNRPIIRHVDDSVVRVILGREQVLRRARGYAPLPIQLKDPMSPLLAVGGHLKNTVAVTAGANVFISQHIGDLETSEAFAAFQKVIASLQNLYNVEPEQIVCDMHPDYLSTKYAGGLDHPTTAVQHHYAHVAACMAENELDGRALGVAWDGTGYGLDGTIWGGEFLLIDESSFQRVASFRQFKLPGSASAIKEPRRSAIGLLFEVFGNELFEQSDVLSLNSFTLPERKVLRRMLTNGLNSPLTSSVGRLFDAVASLVGLRQRARFEGQAAMELEFALDRISTDETYEFRISEGDQSAIQCQAKPVWRTQSAITLDWSPMVRAVLADVERGLPVGEISAKFHNSLVEAIVAVARRIGEARIVLTGGCFQNKYLTERAVRRLEAEGFRPYWHQRVPPNDGGIALGQVYAVVRMKRQHRLTDSLIEIC